MPLTEAEFRRHQASLRRHPRFLETSLLLVPVVFVLVLLFLWYGGTPLRALLEMGSMIMVVSISSLTTIRESLLATARFFARVDYPAYLAAVHSRPRSKRKPREYAMFAIGGIGFVVSSVGLILLFTGFGAGGFSPRTEWGVVAFSFGYVIVTAAGQPRRVAMLARYQAVPRWPTWGVAAALSVPGLFMLTALAFGW